jgi:DNA-binding transcriptional MocR family regulator
MSYKDIKLFDNIRRDDPRPLTQQLVDVVVAAINSGELKAGDRLPPTRAAATEAGVNHLTAARAYRRLAEEGWVTAGVGRGTFVRDRTRPGGVLESAQDERSAATSARGPAPLPLAPGEDSWQQALLPDAEPTYSERILDETFRMSDRPGLISMATGFPSPALCPVDQLKRITQDVFDEEGPGAVWYADPAGIPALRDQLAREGRTLGFATDPSEIVVTTGARQGIDIVARALLRPGDVVCVESPTFVGLLISLHAAGARVIGIPVDEDGFDVDALQRVLDRQDVKLCVLQTSCHNPTGQHLSEERRVRLARLARERNFFVLEDGVYGTVSFDGRPRRRLRELAPSHVIYVDSLSKTIGGGLRIGWLAARGPVRERLVRLKLGSDMQTATLGQHIAARYLAGGTHNELLAEGCKFYARRCDVLLHALERELGDACIVTPPRGGHHIWVTLREPLNERTLYAEAVRHGVSFTPGGVMLAEASTATSFRLSFSLLEPDQLEEGVRRLARAVRALRHHHVAPASAPLS